VNRESTICEEVQVLAARVASGDPTLTSVPNWVGRHLASGCIECKVILRSIFRGAFLLRAGRLRRICKVAVREAHERELSVAHSLPEVQALSASSCLPAREWNARSVKMQPSFISNRPSWSRLLIGSSFKTPAFTVVFAARVNIKAA